MSRVCSVSGKCPSRGHNRSHSMRATIRVYNPNLQTKKVLDPKTGKMKTMRVAASTLRTLTKSPRVKKSAKKAA